MPSKQFGIFMRAIRESANLSVDQGAKSIGVTKSDVESWEGSLTLPAESQIKKISEAYGIEESELLDILALEKVGSNDRND